MSRLNGTRATMVGVTALALVAALSASCSERVPLPLDTPVVTAAPFATAPAASQAPPTRPPTPLTDTATPPPSPTVTPSPPPAVVVAVPELWRPAMARFFAESAPPGWVWELTAGGLPADLVLVLEESPYPAGSRPLALAIPFTTDWENVAGAEAARIIAEGHPIVQLGDWAAMPAGYKALRIDGRLPPDQGYPLTEPWYLEPAPGMEAAATALSAALLASPPADPVVRLAAVGDVMLDRALGYAISRGDLAYPFAGVREQLEAADYTVANLESALGDIGRPAAKSYTFQAPPAAAASLAAAGVDLVSLANNHAMDFGPVALLQGISLLHEAGVATVGAGEDDAAAHAPHLVEINGLRLAFLGYVHVPVEVSGFDTAVWTAGPASPGLAWAHPDAVAADVAAARQAADLVVVIMHSGYEYVAAPSPPQLAAAQAAIAAGASLVIGHHAHILQGVSFAERAVIAYGLGNFAFEIDGDPSTAIMNVWLDAAGVRQVEIVPAIIQFGGQPRLAHDWEAGPIRRQVYYLSSLFPPPADSSP